MSCSNKMSHHLDHEELDPTLIAYQGDLNKSNPPDMPDKGAWIGIPENPQIN
jgi:hypothetical protein